MRGLRHVYAGICSAAVLGVSAAAADAAPNWTVYVGNNNTPTVTPISTATNTAGTPIASGTSGNGPAAIAITPDGATAYAVNSDGTVTPINLSTGTPGTPITVGDDPAGIAVTPDGKTVYVTAGPGGNTVTPISTATNTAGNPITVGSSGSAPFGLAITPDGKTVYVANNNGTTVTPINTATNMAGTPITVGPNPQAVAITPDGKTVWVASSDGIVTPISTATNTPGTQIPLVGDLIAIAITSNGQTAYVADDTGTTVTPINLSTGTPGTAITVDTTGDAPFGLALTPDGSGFYVANSGGNTVTPVTTATNLPGTPITVGPVGSMPFAVAITPQQAPTAGFTATIHGSTAAFNASSSSATHGATVARYDWNFGDGTTALNAGATPSHTYSSPGTYAVTLTVTDSTGCGPSMIFTGQTASCSGNANAVVSHGVTISAPTVRITKQSISSKHRSAKFTFIGSGGFTGLQCALVKKPRGKHKKPAKPSYRPCTSPRTYTHLKIGHYTFYVRAVSGTMKSAPAIRSFTI